MKRVLFYLPSLSPAGGIERVISTIANKLVKSYDLTVLTKDNDIPFYYLNDLVKRDTLDLSLPLNMNSRFNRAFTQFYISFLAIVRIKKYLKGKDFDYIYITHPLSHLELLLANVEHKKIVISEHGASNNYNFIYRCIKWLTYKNCHAYCVPTITDLKFYAKYKFPAKYTPHYKSELNYKKSSLRNRIVLNIGRYTDDKKQLTLLHIWKSIKETDRLNWVLNIVGSGELGEQLKNFIDANNLNESVLLLQPRANVEDFYMNSSIFALTSRSEGFGMVLLEAAGFGLPLISFDCPSGPRDIINDDNGFLITENDISSYKNKLVEMMSDKLLLERLSSGSLNTSRDWSDEKITKIWEGIFE